MPSIGPVAPCTCGLRRELNDEAERLAEGWYLANEREKELESTVERLRAEKDDLWCRYAPEEWADRGKELEAEVERLREALGFMLGEFEQRGGGDRDGAA